MKKWLQILLAGLLAMVLVLLAIGYYYYVPPIPAEVLNKKYEVKPSHFIEIKGMDVHYRVEGLVTDTLPLVLLHGTSSSFYTWEGWVELLRDRKQIIRLDLPGFGLTGPHPQDDYHLETYLNFLQSFLAELGVEQCVLAGNSLGGEIAWRYGLKNPQQVKKLILIGAAGYPVANVELPLSELPLSYLWLRIPLLRALSVKFMTRQAIRNSLEYLYGDPDMVSQEMVELYFDMSNREGNREALAQRMDFFGDPTPLRDIPTIKIPTLIMWGGRDRLIPVENAKRFQENLPNSKLIVFPEAGHMPMEEIPEKSAEATEEFIQQAPVAIKE